MNKKFGIYIDVQNLQATFEKFNQNVRYDKLLEFIKNKYGEPFKAVCFVPYNPEDQHRKRLIDALALMGYRVVTKLIKYLPDGSLKANMDLEICLEIIKASKYLDTIILVTGDGDFVPLVEELNRVGCRVITIGPMKGATSLELIRVSDEYYNLNEIDETVIPRSFTQDDSYESIKKEEIY
ncbi:MAG: NYN domain-containing protein [Candidatus Hydrothermales bacterium]